MKDFFKSNVYIDVNSYVISLNEWFVMLFLTLLKSRLIIDNTINQRFECLKIIIKNRKTISIVWLIFSNKSFVCEWYATKYINFIFKRKNIVVHISNKNFRSRSKMIVFDKFQSIKFNWLNNACFHCVANYVIFSNINMMRFVYLQFIDIMQFQFSSKNENKIKMKSIVIIWNDIDEIKMNCNESYDKCRRVWYIWHFEQCFKKSLK